MYFFLCFPDVSGCVASKKTGLKIFGKVSNRMSTTSVDYRLLGRDRQNVNHKKMEMVFSTGICISDYGESTPVKTSGPNQSRDFVFIIIHLKQCGV